MPLHLFSDEIGAIKRPYLDENFAAFGLLGSAVPGQDISLALNLQIASTGYARIPPGNYLLNAPINVPLSGAVIDASGVIITMNLPGQSAIFMGPSGGFGGSYLKLVGGIWVGTARDWMRVKGANNTPGPTNQYARFIYPTDVVVSGTAIDNFIFLEDAARDLYADRCNSFTKSGYISNGKSVEIHVDNSEIFSSSGAANTRGFRWESAGGGAAYNEGLHVANSTIDGFEYSVDLADIFVASFTTSYIGCATGGRAVNFRPPTTTTHNRETKIGGETTISGQIFYQQNGGAYHSTIQNFTHINAAVNAIVIENNSSNVSIRNGKFEAAVAAVTGVVTSGAANSNIVVSDLDFDSTYTGGVLYSHTAGVGNIIANLSGNVSGELWSKPAALSCLLKGLPVQTASQRLLTAQYNTVDLAGTTIVGANIASISVNCAKGETGWIDGALFADGMNAATQLFTINVPAGMSLPPTAGALWNAAFIYPRSAGQCVTIRIPYYCTADIVAGTLSITNTVGNTVTLQSHSRFGLEKQI